MIWNILMVLIPKSLLLFGALWFLLFLTHSHVHCFSVKNDYSKPVLSWTPLPFPHSSLTDQSWTFVENEKRIRNILVCGDGDLSFSAAIAPQLKKLGISLTATVWEDQSTHSSTYGKSRDNLQTILSSNHSVCFGIDATKLHLHSQELFPSNSNYNTFDRIQFNFPHIKGKSNLLYNRQLVQQFFSSAKHLSSDDGEIHVALCMGQGGCTASSARDWRTSWKVSSLASEENLLLKQVYALSSNIINYQTSSFRARDQQFHVGSVPKLYIFGSKFTHIPRPLQICYRHQLRFILQCQPTKEKVDTMQCELEKIIRNIEAIPQGVRVEIHRLKYFEINDFKPHSKDKSNIPNMSPIWVISYAIVYCGESQPITRKEADSYRMNLLQFFDDYFSKNNTDQFNLRRMPSRQDQIISKSFPYTLFNNYLQHNQQQKFEVIEGCI